MSPKLPFGGKISVGHLFIILGVICMFLTFFLVKSVVGGPSKNAPTAKEQKTVSIVIANRLILPGEMIEDVDLRVVKWPMDMLPPGDVIQDENDVIGHASKVEIYPGAPLYPIFFSGMKSEGGLAWVIPKGMRAITVGVTEIKGVGGFIRPGAKVDILATLEYTITAPSPDGGAKQESARLTQTVLQDVLVLAVGQEFNEEQSAEETTLPPAPELDEKGNPKPVDKNAKAEEKTPEKKMKDIGIKDAIAGSVTLAVSPQQAEALTLAENRGELKLVLRSQDDGEQVALGGASDPDIIPDPGIFAKILAFATERTGAGGFGPMSGMGAPSGKTPGSNISPSSASAPPVVVNDHVGEKRVNVIQGTDVSDVYVKRK